MKLVPTLLTTLLGLILAAPQSRRARRSRRRWRWPFQILLIEGRRFQRQTQPDDQFENRTSEGQATTQARRASRSQARRTPRSEAHRTPRGQTCGTPGSKTIHKARRASFRSETSGTS